MTLNLYTKGVTATAWQQAADCSGLWYRLYLHARHAMCNNEQQAQGVQYAYNAEIR